MTSKRNDGNPSRQSRQINAIVFDLDGTLFDDRQYVEAGFERAAAFLREKFDAETLDDMLREYYEYENYDRVFDNVLEEHGLPASEVTTLIEEYHDQEADLTPFPEVRGALDTLEEDRKLALLTGGKNGLAKSRRLGIDQFFSSICVAPQLGSTKRDRYPFEHVVEALSVRPNETMFVGDNPELDLFWPNRLGMVTVHVDRPSTIHSLAETDECRPDLVVKNLMELVDFL